MSASLPPNTQSIAKKRRLAGFLVLAALAAVLAHNSTRELEDAQAKKPQPVSIARARLVSRAGRFYRIGAQIPFTGWMTDHFPSGALKLRSAMSDGRLHGESVGWFTNGVREVCENFRHGQPSGIRTTWHMNGQKRSEGLLVAGQQQGIYRQWHDNGTLAAEAEFEDGKPNGLSRAWYPSGCLQAEALMNHGETRIRHVYPDGDRREPTLLAANQIHLISTK
jgi:antitoxin component YwqK of YwqJK toxin-antitoxin module